LREQLGYLDFLSFGNCQLFLNVRSINKLKAAATLHAHLHAAASAALTLRALSAGSGTLCDRCRASDSKCEYEDSFHVFV
jgi:hypothetical protein